MGEYLTKVPMPGGEKCRGGYKVACLSVCLFACLPACLFACLPVACPPACQAREVVPRATNITPAMSRRCYLRRQGPPRLLPGTLSTPFLSYSYITNP